MKLVAETAGRQGDLVLDRAGLAVDDTNVDAVFLKQCDHACVVVRNQCGEVADAFLTGTISKPFQQLDAQSPALPLIDDGDSNFGSLWVLGVPDVASDAKAATIDRIQGADCLVVVVVDRGQVTQLRARSPIPNCDSKSLDLRLWTDVLAGHGLRSRSPSTHRDRRSRGHNQVE